MTQPASFTTEDMLGGGRMPSAREFGGADAAYRVPVGGEDSLILDRPDPKAEAAKVAPTPTGGTTFVKLPSGEIWEVPDEKVAEVKQAGGSIAQQDEVDRARALKSHGDLAGAGIAFGSNVVDALGLGAGKAGVVEANRLLYGDPQAEWTADQLRLYDEANPKASMVGQAAGLILPALTTGGASVAEEGLAIGAGEAAAGAVTAPARAASALGRAAEYGVEKLVGKEAQTIAGRAAQRGLALGAQGAVEGGIYGAGSALDESVLGHEQATAEKILAGGLMGAIFGGGIGGGLGVAGGALSKAQANRLAGMARKADDLAIETAAKEAPSGGIQLGPAGGLTEAETKALQAEQRAADRAALAPPTPEGWRGKAAEMGDDLAWRSLNPTKKATQQVMRDLGDEGIARIGRRAIDEGIANGALSYEERLELARERLAKTGEELGSLRTSVTGGGDVVELIQDVERQANDAKKLIGHEAISANLQGVADSMKRVFGVAEEEAFAARKMPREPNYEKAARQFDKEYLPAKPKPWTEADTLEKLRAKTNDAPILNNPKSRDQFIRSKWGASLAELTEADALAVEQTYARSVAEHEAAKARSLAGLRSEYEAQAAAVARANTEGRAEAILKHIGSREVPLGELLKQRQAFDSVIKKEAYDALNRSPRADELLAVRGKFEDFIMRKLDDAAKRAGDPTLTARILEKKRAYQEMSKIVDILQTSSSANMTNRLASPTSKAMGMVTALGGLVSGHGALGILAGPLITAATKYAQERGPAAAAKFLHDLAGTATPKAQTLMAMKVISDGVDSQIRDGARAFVRNAAPAAGRAAATAATKAPSGAKSRSEEYQRMLAEVDALRDANEMQRRTVDVMGISGEHAPRVTAAVGNRVATAAGLVSSKAPPKQPPASVLAAFRESPRAPSYAEFEELRRWLNGAKAPLSTFDLMSANSLTQEHVAALKEISPSLYEQMRTEITEAFSESTKPVSFQKQLQVSMLFDVDVTPYTEPEFMADIQQFYRAVGVAEMSQQKQQRSSHRSNPEAENKSLQTRSQRIESR